MGKEIDLLANYPKTKRDVSGRGASKTETDRAIARKFGKEFFDGDRSHGYGGFNYAPRFWQPVVPTFKDYYNLSSNSTLLDVGCAKGFMLYDFKQLIPGITVQGVDISEYATANCIEEMKPYISVANATSLPFEKHSYDLVVSINTIHNLEEEQCALALKEIERVKSKHAFITVDAYRNEEEKQRMYDWNLTAKTIMHVDQWIAFFNKVGYSGDYYWFLP